MSPQDDDPQTLADTFAAELRRKGSLQVAYRSGQQRDRIRRAGRAAGRILNRPVRTYDLPRAVHETADTPTVTDGQEGAVSVVLDDWGTTNPLEAHLSEVRANRLIDRALDAADGRGAASV